MEADATTHNLSPFDAKCEKAIEELGGDRSVLYVKMYRPTATNPYGELLTEVPYDDFDEVVLAARYGPGPYTFQARKRGGGHGRGSVAEMRINYQPAPAYFPAAAPAPVAPSPTPPPPAAPASLDTALLMQLFTMLREESREQRTALQKIMEEQREMVRNRDTLGDVLRLKEITDKLSDGREPPPPASDSAAMWRAIDSAVNRFGTLIEARLRAAPQSAPRPAAPAPAQAAPKPAALPTAAPQSPQAEPSRSPEDEALASSTAFVVACIEKSMRPNAQELGVYAAIVADELESMGMAEAFGAMSVEAAAEMVLKAAPRLLTARDHVVQIVNEVRECFQPENAA